jgi:peptidoglycan hydrolase-like protein with peptidoglycan-binding domain
VDGIPGLVTRAAIMAYESDRGLPLTGEPGQSLLQNIVLGTDAGAGQASRVEPGPQAQAVIKAVQRSLAGLGFAPGPINGRLGDETARAIRKFEAAQGMKESGRISGPLIARLTRLAGPLQASVSP